MQTLREAVIRVLALGLVFLVILPRPSPTAAIRRAAARRRLNARRIVDREARALRHVCEELGCGD